MFAVIPERVQQMLNKYHTVDLIWRLEYLRRYLMKESSGRKVDGVCWCCGVLRLTVTLTGSSYPIGGEPFEVPWRVYARDRDNHTMHLGKRGKQRRKLARTLLNIIKQELRNRENA
jgi:hypothetical protein